MNPSSVLGKLLVIIVIFVVFGCDAKDQKSDIASILDAAILDAAMSDQMVDTLDVGADMAPDTADAQISDTGAQQIPDMSPDLVDALINEMTPDAGPPVIPGPCVDNEALTCIDLCNTLTSCFSESTCLGFQNGDQTALIDACVSSCGFNSSTRELLCLSNDDNCEVILDRLFMADEALGTLCSGNFSDEDRQACTDICSRTSECTNGGNTMVETEQSCRFQCLVQGAASVSDCISVLACDENFEGQVQACLQGRSPQPPLLTTCDELCDQLALCQPNSLGAIGATTTAETCVQDCGTRLSTPASIACAGRLSCDLSLALTQTCADENLDVPTCEIGCLRVLECSEESNPFGASNAQLQQCITNCSADATLDERRCSFEVSCTPNFLENFYSCIEMTVP
jgi:hypothetical protein